MPDMKVRFKGQYLDMNSSFYSRTVSLNFTYRFGGYWWLAHFSRFCHLQIIDIQQYYKTMYRDTNP